MEYSENQYPLTTANRNRNTRIKIFGMRRDNNTQLGVNSTAHLGSDRPIEAVQLLRGYWDHILESPTPSNPQAKLDKCKEIIQ